MNKKVSDVEILKNLKIFVQDGIQIHTMLRDAFVEKDNSLGAWKHQGSLDVIQGVLQILNGGNVTTLEEMRAEIKKNESGGQDYLR